MSVHDATFKILVLGESGVGKTSLIKRFTARNFKESYLSTIGIDSCSRDIDVDGKKIKLQIWDTAGQERFRTLTNHYYRGAMGILLVYDVSSDESFINVENWMASIRENATSNVCRVLVGNKADMPEYLREVTTEQGEQHANKFNIQFFETSAKEGTNVDEVFNTLAGLISKNALKATDMLHRQRKTLVSSNSNTSCC